MSFYGTDIGDRLIDERYFPGEIKKFLNKEKELLSQADSAYDFLVEVGCMHGRYMEWALVQNKAYIGLDVVSRYIERGRKRAQDLSVSDDRCQFILGGAEEIDVKIIPELLGIKSNRFLLFFPFNSFGNMRDCNLVIGSLKRSKLPFLISTYLTTSEATSCRQKYYEACQYHGLKVTEDVDGVRFSADEGLCSVAYHADFLLGIFRSADLEVKGKKFSKIGIAYSSLDLFVDDN